MKEHIPCYNTDALALAAVLGPQYFDPGAIPLRPTKHEDNLMKKNKTIDEMAQDFRETCKRNFAAWLQGALQTSQHASNASDLERLAARELPKSYHFVRQYIHSAMSPNTSPNRKVTIVSIEFAIAMALLLRLPVEEGLQAAGYRVAEEFAGGEETARMKVLWNAMSTPLRSLTLEMAEVLWKSSAVLDTESAAERELLETYRGAGEREKAMFQQFAGMFKTTLPAPSAPAPLLANPQTVQEEDNDEDADVTVLESSNPGAVSLETAQTSEAVLKAASSLPDAVRRQIAAALESVSISKGAANGPPGKTKRKTSKASP